jgi:hypothetical protein
MRPYSILAAVAFAAYLAAAPATHAQVIEAGPPIKIMGEKSGKPPKGTRLRAEVISCTAAAITVREPDEPRKIHTFSYSPELNEKIMKLMDSGGYQNGDRVKIRYNPQTSIATDIRGKPSKPN